MYCTCWFFSAKDGLICNIGENKIKSNKYIRWIFRPSVRSFSTKCSALGFLNTSQCPVMVMVFFFQLTNAITQYYFSEYPLRSKGNKTAQHVSFFIPSSMFITPWCAKISIRIDSFILLWWKRESNAKNDTPSNLMIWVLFQMLPARRNCFHLDF